MGLAGRQALGSLLATMSAGARLLDWSAVSSQYKGASPKGFRFPPASPMRFAGKGDRQYEGLALCPRPPWGLLHSKLANETLWVCQLGWSLAGG